VSAGDLDIPAACAVLELETDLRAYRASLTRPVPEPSSPWERAVKRLWFKVFQMSTSNSWRDVPSAPADLAEELEGLEPRVAAVRLVARARARIAGRPGDALAEAEWLTQNTERFLETPEGRERKAYLDRSLNP
jgi:hypothetical protein